MIKRAHDITLNYCHDYQDLVLCSSVIVGSEAGRLEQVEVGLTLFLIVQFNRQGSFRVVGKL